MRSLHLPAAGEATSPTDLNGTGEGVLWHHHHHPAGTWGCDACQCDTVTPDSLEEGWWGGKEMGAPKWEWGDDCYQVGKDG